MEPIEHSREPVIETGDNQKIFRAKIATLLTWLRLIGRVVVRWRENSRSRAQLARFDDRMLRDIGVTPADVWRESLKPWWRP